MEKSSNRNIIATVVIIIILFSLLIVFIRQLGFFDFKGTDASAKIVAASLAFIGVVFTACVTFIGLLFKQSIDQRNIRIRKIELERESR